MRKLMLLGLALLTLAAAPATEAATRNVALARTGFLPASATIAVGDTVTWTNNDTVNRSVVSDSGLFSSGILSPGQSFSHTFENGGTFRYRDGTRSARRGTVVVRVPSATVSIAASKQSLIFGADVNLSGSLSTRQSGQPVTLVVKPFGQPTERIQLTTGTDGVWRYSAQPRIQTAFSVEYRTASSPAVTVSVRPRVTLRKVAARRFAVSVVAGQSFAGKTGYVARWAAKSQRWRMLKRFTLAQSRTSATVSIANVTLRVARRTKLRAFISQAQTQPAYIAGYSNITLG